MFSNATMSGSLLSNAIIRGGRDIKSSNEFINGTADITTLIDVGVPFIVYWVATVVLLLFKTNEEGFLTGARKLESTYPKIRIVQCLLIYITEGLHIIFCLFIPATVKSWGTDRLLGIANVWLWNGPLLSTFYICCFLLVISIVLYIIPVVFRYTRLESYIYLYLPCEKIVTTDIFDIGVSFFRDCFMLWIPVPMMIQMLRPIPCVYYLDDSTPTALEDITDCLSSQHMDNAITGGIIFILYYSLGILSGIYPPLLNRYGDLMLNSRFTSLSFALKGLMAVVHVFLAPRHKFYTLGVMLILQVSLLLMSISMRPCLVEKVNFHRSLIYAIGVSINIMCLISAGVDDHNTSLIWIIGIIGILLAIIMAIAKYYFMSCGRTFSDIVVVYMDDTNRHYTGDVCLGREVPHGRGKLQWDSKVLTGKFRYGKLHGYGTLTLGKYYYEGYFNNGLRNGFGMTNMMFIKDIQGNLCKDTAAESFEGFWVDNVHDGQGTKKFCDGDRYDGMFKDGNEHGPGLWTILAADGTHVISGEWKDGVFLGGMIDSSEQRYDGELRYGVPHGAGTMYIGDDIFEGEWRAGKLHGFGTVRMGEGTYEGNFKQGLYSNEGKWSDGRGVYVGCFKDSQKHGHGIEVTAEGTYEGSFDKGYRHGLGTFRCSETNYYHGEWQKNVYHGNGLLVTDDFEYDGMWAEGRREGRRGHIRFSDGVEYDGGWLNYKFHDQGTLHIPGLGEYKGMFRDGNKAGHGQFTFLDSSEYIGEWDRDLANGEGRFAFSSRAALALLRSMDPEPSCHTFDHVSHFMDVGGVIKGQFEDGEAYGQGKLRCSDGSVYKGLFKKSMPHGVGTLKHADGSVYEGEWSDGVKEGMGRMIYADGKEYYGEWYGGMRHGNGAIKAPDGTVVQSCEWVNDVPLVQDHMPTFAVDAFPAVDIDEFLQAIMPCSLKPIDIEESRSRKRVDVEEIYHRMRIFIIMGEDLMWKRLVKKGLLQEHRVVSMLITREQQHEHISLQKPVLLKVLNYWKAAFRAEYKREPNKSDILSFDIIAPVYKRYMDISKE